MGNIHVTCNCCKKQPENTEMCMEGANEEILHTTNDRKHDSQSDNLNSNPNSIEKSKATNPLSARDKASYEEFSKIVSSPMINTTCGSPDAGGFYSSKAYECSPFERNYDSQIFIEAIPGYEDADNISKTPPRGSKKQLAFVNLMNKPPLEIINELVTESFTDSIRKSEAKIKRTEHKQKSNIDEMKIELKSDLEDYLNENGKNFASQTDLYKIDKHFILKSVRQNLNYTGNEINNNKDTDNSMENSISSKKKKYEINFVKKQVEKTDINSAWKNISISNVIPENKLLSNLDDEIMFQSVLDKFTASTNKRQKHTHIDKFCMINKKEFRCYKSKETFLTLQNPSQRILFENISNVKRLLIPENGSKLNANEKTNYYFYLVMGSNELSHIYNWSSEDEMSRDHKSIFSYHI